MRKPALTENRRKLLCLLGGSLFDEPETLVWNDAGAVTSRTMRPFGRRVLADAINAGIINGDGSVTSAGRLLYEDFLADNAGIPQ